MYLKSVREYIIRSASRASLRLRKSQTFLQIPTNMKKDTLRSRVFQGHRKMYRACRCVEVSGFCTCIFFLFIYDVLTNGSRSDPSSKEDQSFLCVCGLRVNNRTFSVSSRASQFNRHEAGLPRAVIFETYSWFLGLRREIHAQSQRCNDELMLEEVYSSVSMP